MLTDIDMAYVIATRDAEVIVGQHGAQVVLVVQTERASVRVPMTYIQAVELFGYLDVAIDAAQPHAQEAK